MLGEIAIGGTADLALGGGVRRAAAAELVTATPTRSG